MNLGYEGETKIKVDGEDLTEAHHISLYLKLLENFPAKNISIFEIGCGRGGGCYVLQKYLGLKNISAIDLSAANIKLARKNVPGVNFKRDNAATFTTTELYGLIVNLESSHAYPSRKEFFEKVFSALNKGGFFAYGDVVQKRNMEDTEQWMTQAGFTVLHKETINRGVVSSIEKNSRKQYPFLTRFPFFAPKNIHRFLATIHSATFAHLKSGELLYRVYLLQKN